MAKDTKKPTQQAKNAKKQPVNARKTKPQAKKATPTASKKNKTGSTTTKKTTTPTKGKSTVSKSTNKKNNFVPATKNVSDKIKPGDAIRSRDEYFLNGTIKERKNDNSKELYRVAYVVARNDLDELAVVKRTASKGHFLKDNPKKKFKPHVYINDNEGKPIKLSNTTAKPKKFVRSKSDDITQNDVEYIQKRCKKFPDNNERLNKLKARKKRKK